MKVTNSMIDPQLRLTGRVLGRMTKKRFGTVEVWGTDDVPGYAAPARAADFAGLPPTWKAPITGLKW